MNIIVPLGAIGLYESYNKNYTFNADTLRYAKMAIDKMNSGVTSPKYGVFQFQYDTKENALSEMNYSIAFITYHVNKNKKEGIEYYYKVSQMPGKNKTTSAVFETIGAYYFDEVAALADKVKSLIAEQQALPTDEEKAAKDKEIKSAIAMLNAYLERSMDGYGRARALVTKTDADAQKYKDFLTAKLKTLYTVRFEKEDGLDSYIASAIKKPLPDPTQPVQPVEDPEKPADATGTTTPNGANTVQKSAPAAKPKAAAAGTAKTAAAKSEDAATAKKPKKRR